MENGLFISFEGADGSGKSTQARLLVETLKAAGHDVVWTREPGGTPGAELLRSIILQGDGDRWSAGTELLLFTAARLDHCEKFIKPSLAAGKIVVCDRFADSTRVYQGAASQLDREGTVPDISVVNTLHELMIGFEPDVTFVLTMSADESYRRAMARIEASGSSEDRFESLGDAFQQRVRAGFEALASEYPVRCIEIDASGSVDLVSSRILMALSERYGISVSCDSPAL